MSSNLAEHGPMLALILADVLAKSAGGTAEDPALALHPDRRLSDRELEVLTGLSRTSLWRRRCPTDPYFDPSFPKKGTDGKTRLADALEYVRAKQAA